MDNKKGCNLGVRWHPENPSRSGSFKFLLEASAFPCAVAQEEQTTSANGVMALDHDLIDTRGTIQECTFDTHTVAGNPADSESGIIAVFMGEENGPFEFLHTFAGTFLDFYMDTHRIP
jgi:hypothetical protein